LTFRQICASDFPHLTLSLQLCAITSLDPGFQIIWNRPLPKNDLPADCFTQRHTLGACYTGVGTSHQKTPALHIYHCIISCSQSTTQHPIQRAYV
jgi:hypothetical protein